MMDSYEGLFPQEIYQKYLTVISGIEFTYREIDVIACIIYGKNPTGIATFLTTKDRNIEVRTIETHIFNIRRKIGGSSRGSIVEFIENSDKYKAIRSYYLNLLVYEEFKKALNEIAELIKPYSPSFFIIVENNETLLTRKLKDHLKYIGANVFHEVIEKFISDSIALPKVLNKQYFIYIVLKQKEKVLQTEISIPLIDISPQNIIFLLEDKENTNLSLNLSHVNYIDLIKQKKYYFLFLELLEKLFPNLNLEKVIVKFRKRYDNIYGGPTHTNNIFNNQDLKENTIKIKLISLYNKRKWLYLFLMSIFITGSGSFLYSNKGSYKEHNKSELAIQGNISKMLPKFFEDLSTCNLTREEADKNYNIIKQFDQVIEQISYGQMQKYFNGNALKSNELVNSIYNLNAISSYFLFKEHDAEKAEKILKYAKTLAENYLAVRSKLQIDFEKLTPAEIYTELSIIKDLPEMYTITIYFLGRSFIYRRDIEQAEKYFELSRYLGEKLSLFEEVLSINSLTIVKGDKVDISIKNGDYAQAKNYAQECINTYQQIKEDSKEYIINYIPNNKNPTIIIPKKDIYRLIDCCNRIIKIYTKLILITDNPNEKNSYLEAVSNQLIGNNTSPGILDLLTKSNDVLPRIKADLHNSLGYFFLELYDKNIDFKQLKSNLIKKLNLINGDDLQILYQIFDLAKSLSRNTEFTKADSYNGLISVYRRQINQGGLTKEGENELLIQIRKLKDQRDNINRKLNRINTKYEE